MAKDPADLDRRLLTLLRQNARESFVRLAETLGISEGTVRARIKRLRETGVIRRFTIRTAGPSLKALIEVVSDTDVETAAVAETIAGWVGVEVVYETSGSEDLAIIVEAEDTEGLNAIIENVRKLQNVRSTRTRMILREVF